MTNVLNNKFSKPFITTALVISMASPSFAFWNSTASEFELPRGTVTAKAQEYDASILGLDMPTEEIWTPVIGTKAVNKRIQDRLAQEEEEKKRAEDAAYSPVKATAKFAWDVASPFVIPMGFRIAGDIFLSAAGDYLPKAAEYVVTGLSNKLDGGFTPLSHIMGTAAKGEAIRQMPRVLSGAEKVAGFAYLAGEKIVGDYTRNQNGNAIIDSVSVDSADEISGLRAQGLVSKQRQTRELTSTGMTSEEADEWSFVLEPRFETKAQEDAYMAYLAQNKLNYARIGGEGTEYDPNNKALSAKAWKASKYGLALAWTAAEPYVIPVAVRFAGDYTLGLVGPWLANRAGDIAEATFKATNNWWTGYVPGSETVGTFVSRHTAKGEFYRNAASMMDSAEKYAAPTYRFLQKSASTIKSAAVSLYEKAKPAAKKVASAASKVASSARSAFSSLKSKASGWFSSISSPVTV
jgi:hypothetical protein